GELTLASQLLFFFQAEDGIRDFHVTGVQTCALPILAMRKSKRPNATPTAQDNSPSVEGTSASTSPPSSSSSVSAVSSSVTGPLRSEERRVGREWRSRGSTHGQNKERRQSRSKSRVRQ